MILKSLRVFRKCSSWLRSDCGIELCVIVEVILDDLIALARDLREPRAVEDVNFSASVFDKSFSLENPGCRRNSGAAPSKHVCEKLVRNLERVDVCAVRTDEQPAGESLFKACLGYSRVFKWTLYFHLQHTIDSLPADPFLGNARPDRN